MLTPDLLRAWHRRMGPAIRRRLEEFEEFGRNASDEDLFRELAFCMYAANTSSALAEKAVACADGLLLQGDAEQLARRLHENRFRFWRTKALAWASCRDYLREAWGFRIRERLQREPDPSRRRELLAADPGVRGVGYKEASHFLRNIGFRGYAILDRHILRGLRELAAIGGRLAKKAQGRRRYLLVEKKMKRFSERIGIPMDELDLAIWSYYTGYIGK